MGQNTDILKTWKFITDGISVLGKNGPDTVNILMDAGNQLASELRQARAEIVDKTVEIGDLHEELRKWDPGVEF